MDKSDILKHIAEQLFEQGNLSIIDSSFSADYIAHAGDKTHSGQNFIKQFIKQIRRAIPDIKIEKIECISQTSNFVTWQRTLSGTHKADLKGIPASNKKVKYYEMVVTRFDNDIIAEEWLASDLGLQLMVKHK